MIKLAKKYGGLQFFAPAKVQVNVNGEDYNLSYNDAENILTWGGNADLNADFYTISGNNVVWNNGEILQENNIDVLPTDNFANLASKPYYTTQAATPRLSVDVSTLAGWANLSAGEKSITIVAKASGFKDSAPSASVKVTKAASTKTLEAGTYKWKDAPALQLFNETIAFASGGSNWTGLTVDPNKGGQILYIGTQGEHIAYGALDWGDESDKTITLATDQQISADFYEWAITGGNLVKQAESETWVLNETLNISGTTYFNNIEMRYSGQTRIPPIKSLKVYEFSDGPVTAYEVIGEEQEEYAEGSSKYYLYQTGGGGDGWVSDTSGTKYNIWTFATPPSGDLLTWLQANGTKQSK